MDPIVISYTIYLVLSIALTVWVAATLHRNGRVFLVQVFQDREELADSVNHLLRVGFYLVNLGFISLALKTTEIVRGERDAIELLSVKIGTVLAVLGVMHLFTLYILSRISRANRGRRHAAGPEDTRQKPPVFSNG